MFKWLLIGLLVSVGWHIGMLLFELVKEVIFTRLHAAEWYAVLCKKKPAPNKPMKKKVKEIEAYRGTSIGFVARR